MIKWQTTAHALSADRGIVPASTVAELDCEFRSVGVFVGDTEADGTTVLRRAVRMTRLRREWNKYQRIIKKCGYSFVVLHNNEPMVEIGPPAKG